jgi:hypothetical protein
MKTAVVLRRIVVLALLCSGLVGLCVAAQSPQSSSSSTPTAAKETWQKEFDYVCSRTEQAMSFSTEQLSSLIERCDALQPQLDKLDETRKKVYSGRLHQCRGLYAYVLESKKNEKK